MAIVDNFWLKNQRKRLAGAVIYQAMGQTRSRELAPQVSNPRTQAQMTQRVRWANLVSFYRANKSWSKYAFETKAQNQSEYNKFMSLNVASSQVYLTKSEAASGACVLAPYVVTQGSLDAIEQNLVDAGIVTNLYYDDTANIRPNTPVNDFSNYLVANNPGLRYGDQLSVIRLYQLANPTSGVPYVQLRKYELVLSSDNTRQIREYLPAELMFLTTVEGKKAITIDKVGRYGAITFVLSRTVGGKTYVSTQRLICVGLEALQAYYSSDDQLRRAIVSYGDTDEAFLSSTYAYTSQSAGVATSILYASVNGVNYPAGSELVLPDDNITWGDVLLQFNGACPIAESYSIEVVTSAGSFQVESGAGSGSTVGFIDVEVPRGFGSATVFAINLLAGTVPYSIGFVRVIRNEDTIHGLE